MLIFQGVPSWTLMWNLKNTKLKRKIWTKPPFLGFHVNFPCTLLETNEYLFTKSLLSRWFFLLQRWDMWSFPAKKSFGYIISCLVGEKHFFGRVLHAGPATLLILNAKGSLKFAKSFDQTDYFGLFVHASRANLSYKRCFFNLPECFTHTHKIDRLCHYRYLYNTYESNYRSE